MIVVSGDSKICRRPAPAKRIEGPVGHRPDRRRGYAAAARCIRGLVADLGGLALADPAGLLALLQSDIPRGRRGWATSHAWSLVSRPSHCPSSRGRRAGPQNVGQTGIALTEECSF